MPAVSEKLNLYSIGLTSNSYSSLLQNTSIENVWVRRVRENTGATRLPLGSATTLLYIEDAPILLAHREAEGKASEPQDDSPDVVKEPPIVSKPTLPSLRQLL